MNVEKRRFRFPKTAKLTTKKDYETVFDHPLKVSNRFFTVLFKPNSMTCSRLGAIVSRRMIKKAWMRNRIKRIVRESFRHFQHFIVGFDIVTITKASCLEQDALTLRKGVDELWEKLNSRYQKFSP